MKIVKIAIIALFIIVLGLPHLGFLESSEKESLPELSIGEFNEGIYQSKFLAVLKHNLSNKDFFARVKNQIDFSFFGEINNDNLVLEEGGSLVKEYQLKEFNGKTYIGRNHIKTKLKRMAFVSDKLKEKGVSLLFVLMPTKPYYLAKNNGKNKSSNASVFNNLIKGYEINYLYGTGELTSEEDESRPLYFTKYNSGITDFGNLTLMQGIVRESNKLLDNPLNSIKIDVLEELDTIQSKDELNVLFRKSNSSQPKVRYSITEKHELNNQFLCIGDSSYIALHKMGLQEELFSKSTFWYDFKLSYESKDMTTSTNVFKENIFGKIENYQLVVLAMDPYNLDNFSFGLIDYLYNFYSPEGGLPNEYSQYERSCEGKRKGILRNRKNKELVASEAKREGVNYYDNLRGHVQFFMDTEKKGWSREAEKISEYEARFIAVKNQFLKLPHKRKSIKDSANNSTLDFNFLIDVEVDKEIKYKDIDGFPSISDSISPLQLAIMEIENKVILDSSWYRKIQQQAKEESISESRNLWENGKYVCWLKYQPYVDAMTESENWVYTLYYKNEILKKENWVENIKKTALTLGLDFETLLTENINFLIYTNRNKFKVQLTVEEVGKLLQEIIIRNDDKWKNSVRIDAQKKGISFEECLRGHAAFVYAQKKYAQKQN